MGGGGGVTLVIATRFEIFWGHFLSLYRGWGEGGEVLVACFSFNVFDVCCCYRGSITAYGWRYV